MCPQAIIAESSSDANRTSHLKTSTNLKVQVDGSIKMTNKKGLDNIFFTAAQLKLFQSITEGELEKYLMHRIQGSFNKLLKVKRL